MNEWVIFLIQMLQALPNEGVGIIIYAAALGSMFVLHHFFGKEGLFLFIVLTVFLANIQCLKVIKLAFFSHPVAMGSILFTTNLLATDILSEYYGRKQAEKAIWLGFSGLVMSSIFMLLTLGTKIISADPGTPFYHSVEVHQAMGLLFAPSPALFLASLLAYLVSQYIDVTFFLWMKQQTKGRLLGLRTFLATLLSGFIDNSIFSFLAWKVFYPLPIDFQTFFVTYMIGTFALRILISMMNMPLIYFIRRQSRSFFDDAHVS